jgi:hypothetical protein
MLWRSCRQTHSRLRKIIGALRFTHVDPSRIFCVRGYGSTSEAWARIWGLPTLWQQVLGIRAAYVVEIIEPEFSRRPSRTASSSTSSCTFPGRSAAPSGPTARRHFALTAAPSNTTTRGTSPTAGSGLPATHALRRPADSRSQAPGGLREGTPGGKALARSLVAPAA